MSAFTSLHRVGGTFSGIFSDIFVFWLHSLAYEILVPSPGIKPVSPDLEAWNPNHETISGTF